MLGNYDRTRSSSKIEHDRTVREWEGGARSWLCSGFEWLPLHLILKTSLGQHVKSNWKYNFKWHNLLFAKGLWFWSTFLIFKRHCWIYTMLCCNMIFIFYFKAQPSPTQFFYLSIFNTFHFPWSTNSISGLTWNTTSSMPEMNWRWTVLKFKATKYVLYDFFYTWLKI